MNPVRVSCPTCKREVDWSTPSRPFCSERCRLVDLGAWLAEQHRIADESTTAESDPAPEPPSEG